MSDTAEKLLVLADQYEQTTIKELVKSAKEKEKKKLDPKAKVRNRGKVIFPAERSKDKKDHFEINNIGQARNALARSHGYDKAPPWYNGSLQGLQEAVRRAVKKHYPSIEISEPGKKKKSSAVEISVELLNKYGQ